MTFENQEESSFNATGNLLRTPMASPPSATPIATPLSSSSVYTLASIPNPKVEEWMSISLIDFLFKDDVWYDHITHKHS